jgi:predicted amidohydrolase YtcJ
VDGALRMRADTPDIAIVGATVHTLDPRRPHASAVAVARGRIVAVGDDAGVRASCDGGTELIDGRGLTVVPGLVDAHVHPILGADLTRGVDLTQVRDRSALRTRLAAERAGAAPGAVLRGWGLDYAVYGPNLDGRQLERDAGGPALVAFFDFHTFLATPSLLTSVGIDAPVTFPDASQIVMRDGAPTGELREMSAYRHVDARLPPLGEAERGRVIVATQRRMNAVGLTGGHAMDGTPETFALLDALEARDELSLRLVVPLQIDPDTADVTQEEWTHLRDARGRLWRGGVAKFFADGVIETGTAWLTTPDAQGGGTVGFWPDPTRLRAAIRRFAAAGFQCATHAIGDAAVGFTLDAYRDAPSRPVLRHRVEHAETLPDALLARFGVEGVVCSMQPLHGQWRQPDGDDEWTRRLGPRRAGDAWRAADVVRSGATLALGSDWPIASYDPRIGMAYAISRRRPNAARAIDPTQGVTPLQALRGYTMEAAYAVSEEAVAGRIAPGLRADLTVFAGDPLHVPPDDLAALPVHLTMVDGRVVYRR